MTSQAVITLSIDGTDVLLVDLVVGTEAVSRPFSLRVTARDESATARTVSDLLGKVAALTITSRKGDVAHRTGIVERVTTDEQSKWVVYDLTISPVTAPLTLGLNSRVYQEQTVQDVITDVLSRGEVPSDKVSWSLGGSLPTRVYVAQYLESDWSFVERLAADEGISYYFDHAEAGSSVVFCDKLEDAPTLPGGDTFKVAADTRQMLIDEVVVARVGKAMSVASQKVTLRDYDPSKPKTKLEAMSGDGTYEIYDYPGRFLESSVGSTRAERALDVLRSRTVTMRGETPTPRLCPGHRFTIQGHELPAFDAEYLCVQTEWRASRTDGVRTTWTAVPSSTPFRPASLLDADREMPGSQTGVVAGPPGKELYTSDTGDIRVQFYWDREGKHDDKASTFMRVGQFALGGSMVRPRVGWDVLVEHHQGSANAPFVVSHVYDGEHPPPYALPGNKTRTAWQTATTPGGGSANEIRFEDKKGSEEIFLNASKDMAVTVGDKKVKNVGVDHSHEIGANHQVTIGSNHSLTVGAGQETKVGASETLSVTAERTTEVGGSDSSTIGAARTVTAVGGHTLDAEGGRSLTVGASMMDISALSVARLVLGSCSVTVGAAWISAAGTGLDNMTVGASAETVGGAKIQLGGGSIDLKVKGALAETVGGAYLHLPGGAMTETATGNLTVNVGGAFIGNAPNIEIEADNEISITCGGSSLTIKSGSIEVKSPSLASPGATISKTGSKVEHNA